MTCVMIKTVKILKPARSEVNAATEAFFTSVCGGNRACAYIRPEPGMPTDASQFEACCPAVAFGVFLRD